jgi:hypothetical protein
MTNANQPKIVVITPVKNEAWILPRFLATTSQRADLIIVADQNSFDDSRSICGKFAKVRLIENSDPHYAEDSRQQLLIRAARSLVQGPKLLFGLDADEILAANAPVSADWSRMLKAPPGTLFRFEKPDLHPTPMSCVRGANPAHPLAYMDDGREHAAHKIHSQRVPNPPPANQVFLGQIKILHYACTRPRTQRAKTRMYSVLENMMGTWPTHTRVWGYRRGVEVPNWKAPEPTPKEWLEGWEKLGIDMRTVCDSEVPWQDLEVLSHFAKYGFRRFWIDDIWDIDWEALRQQVLKDGIPGMPQFRIDPPPWRINAMRASIQSVVAAVHKLRTLPRRKLTVSG